MVLEIWQNLPQKSVGPSYNLAIKNVTNTTGSVFHLTAQFFCNYY